MHFSILEWTAIAVLFIHSAVWFLRWEIVYRRHDSLTPRLHDGAADGNALPSVNAFVPARDEEAHIEAAARSLVAQDHPNFHVVIVDDRSTDGTPEILARVAAESDRSRVTVINAPPLPDGWMGKCHALSCAVKSAPTKADYYLFTDADVVFEPEVARRAAMHLNENNGDLLALFPRIHCLGFWENAILPLLSHIGFIALNPKKISDPNRKEFIGIGAFCMLRRSMYEKWGGHEAIRNEVIDDMAMGLKTKREKGIILVAKDPTAIQLRMYSDLYGIIRGFEKNMHQAVGRGIPGAVAAALFFPLTHALPLLIGLLVLMFDLYNWPLWGSAFAVYLLTGAILVKRMRNAFTFRPLIVILTYPLGAFLASYIMLRSAYFSEIKKQIRWRGRSLPRGRQKTRLVG